MFYLDILAGLGTPYSKGCLRALKGVIDKPYDPVQEAVDFISFAH